VEYFKEKSKGAISVFKSEQMHMVDEYLNLKKMAAKQD
jgi:hypothetical protein